MIHDFLQAYYWAENISLATGKKAIKKFYVLNFMKIINKLALQESSLILQLLRC